MLISISSSEPDFVVHLQMEREVEFAQRERMEQWNAALVSMDRHARFRARHQAERRYDQAMRRAIEHNALLPWISDDQLKAIFRKYKKAVEREFWSGEPYEVHHIVPLKGFCEETGEHIVCGLHVPWNLAVVTREENRKLGAVVADDCLTIFDADPFGPSAGNGDAQSPF